MNELEPQLARLQKRVEREREAREAAERLLEDKSRELYEANNQLSQWAHTLEDKVNTRTQELAAALELAQAGERAKTRFLAVMSHELRTPMNGIMGMAELLSLTPLSAAQQELLHSLRDSADAMLALISDLLDLSTLENGAMQLQSEKVNLAGLLDGVCTAYRLQANSKGLSLWLDKSVHLPWVLTDRDRLRQIISNLLSNAVKFSDSGEIHVQVKAERLGREDVLLEVVVEDQGPGISPQQQSTLFHHFSMADNSSTRSHGGTGMGLAICRQLAVMMGGDIAVESRLGEGSRFTLRLQLASCIPDTVEGTADFSVADSALQSLQLLVAEDNPLNQKLIVKMLEKLGIIHITLAANGAEAVNACRQSLPDLILMDMQMPEMDGLAATRAIRGLPLSRQPMIVALTANAFEEDRQACLAAGMDDFLSKPVNLPALIAALGQAHARAAG